VLEIRYEDLIRDSDSTLQQVCKFLGLIPHSPEPLDSGGNQRYFNTWRELKTDRRGRSLYKRIVAKYESRVREYGYSLEELEMPAIQPSTPEPRPHFSGWSRSQPAPAWVRGEKPSPFLSDTVPRTTCWLPKLVAEKHQHR